MFWSILKKVLFVFDPETAHAIAKRMLRLFFRLHPRTLSIMTGSNPGTLAMRASINVAGLTFHSRVGLAAGFDKNGDWLEMLPFLGFGFAEIGTVTPRPQGGNPRPRLIRIPERQDLFNCMGFNNLGSTLVAVHVERARKRLPDGFRVGINLGKNKTTPNAEAADDYENAMLPFLESADYFVINVSSPNTPGLRDLQSEESLKRILDRVSTRIEKSVIKKRPPVFLKLAPELTDEALGSLVEALDQSTSVSGYVLTNTLQGVQGDLKGGISGASLTTHSHRSLKIVRPLTKRPIISVGGIMSIEEAEARVRLGANLIQIYTGWVYRGPRFPVEIDRHLQLTLT